MHDYIDPSLLKSTEYQIESYRDAVLLYPFLMQTANLAISDFDGVLFEGGIIPRTSEGLLDIRAVKEISPLTIPMFQDIAIFQLMTGPFGIETGKSYSVTAAIKLIKQIKYDLAWQWGMLKKPIEQHSPGEGFNFSHTIHIKPDFLERHTGRMYAIDRNGKPDRSRLILDYCGLDGGGRIIDTDSGESRTLRFSTSFYDKLTRLDVMELFRASTRESKKERQARIMNKYTFSDAPDAEWLNAVKLTGDYSYASPEIPDEANYGAKFNLEFGLNKILASPELLEKWIQFAQSLGYTNTLELSDIDTLHRFIESVLRKYFPHDIATININFVDEAGGMGPRTIIDINPADSDKHRGFETIVHSAESVYTAAHMRPPKLFGRRVVLDDSPHQNGDSLVKKIGGWTNVDLPLEKSHGFPVYNNDLLRHFGVKFLSNEPLTKLEHTFMFLKFLLYYRLGIPIPPLSESLKQKINVPYQYEAS